MKSPKPYLIVFLALTTLGGAALAWHQYQELVELRAAAMDKDERADLQKRMVALEKLNRELQDQLAAFRLGNADGTDAVAGTAGDAAADDRGGRGGRGGPPGRGGNFQQQFNAIRDLMAKPEVQAMVSVQQKAVNDARYAALFNKLNLQPEQLDKLKSLLTERQTAVQDVMAAARDQGMDPRTDPEGFRKLITDARNEVNTSIKSVLGDDGYAQLQNFEQTQPQRNLVNDLQQRLSYSNTPLTPAQADQLVQILATNAPQRQANTGTTGQPQEQPGGRGPGDMGGMLMGALLGGAFDGRGLGNMGGILMGILGGGGPGGGLPAGGGDGGRGGPAAAPVTSAAVAQAQTVLAPPQLAALQQIQQQQQTQQQLQQLVLETLAASRAANSGGTATGGASTGTPDRKRGGGG